MTAGNCRRCSVILTTVRLPTFARSLEGTFLTKTVKPVKCISCPVVPLHVTAKAHHPLDVFAQSPLSEIVESQQNDYEGNSI